MVIVAGYTAEMATFIGSNPGLKSRFSRYIEFPDYSLEELKEIFFQMCKESDYELKEEAKQVLHEKLKSMIDNKDVNFANAREIRNYFEMVISRQATRVASNSCYDEISLTSIEAVDML